MKKIIFLLILAFPFSTANANNKLKQIKANEAVAKYGCIVERYVHHFGDVISPSYIIAGILQESTSNPEAISKSNAKGLLQIMEKRALAQVRISFPNEHFSNNLFNPYENIKIAIAYYTYLAVIYKKGTIYNYPEAQAIGYNMGPHRGEAIVAKNPFKNKYVLGMADWLKYVPNTICPFV